MVRRSATSPELRQSAHHINLPNRKQTINKTEVKVHSPLRAFERVRSKWTEGRRRVFFLLCPEQ